MRVSCRILSKPVQSLWQITYLNIYSDDIFVVQLSTFRYSDCTELVTSGQTAWYNTRNSTSSSSSNSSNSSSSSISSRRSSSSNRSKSSISINSRSNSSISISSSSNSSKSSISISSLSSRRSSNRISSSSSLQVPSFQTKKHICSLHWYLIIMHIEKGILLT
jgi:hypothetical protein